MATRVLDAREERWDALAAQVDAYVRGSDPDRLLRAARELIAIDPEHELGHRMAAEAHLQKGEARQAVALGKRALALEPDDGFIHYRLGVFYRFADRLQDAQRHVLEAIEGEPEYAPYWVELGQIALAEDDRVTARQCAARALRYAPGDARALHLKARALPTETQKGLLARVRALEEALAADPGAPSVWHDKARAHLRLRELPAAEEAAREALLLRPTNSEFRKTLYAVLKGRSWGYRLLRWPGDLVAKGFGLIQRMPWPVWLAICAIGIGTRFVLVLVVLGILWLLLVFPLLKVYEFLITADIRQRAEEIGARSGGFLGIHAWPFPLRLGAFVLVAAGFWYGVFHALLTRTGRSFFGWVFVVVILVGLLVVLLGLFLELRDKRRARRRRRVVRKKIRRRA